MPSKSTVEHLQKKISRLEQTAATLKKAIQTVTKSERRYKQIFENLQDVYYEASLDGIILEISPSIENISAYTREELIGQSLYDIYRDAQKRDEFVSLILEKGAVNDYEIVLRNKNGRPHPCSISTRLVKDAEGSPQKLIGSLREISRRKQAEAEARAHQERFKTFFSSVEDAIFVHPLQTEGFAPFIEVNDIACERYGYTREEFLTLSARDITKKMDVDRHAAAAHRKKLLEARRLFFETTHIKKSGEEFPVEINSNIVEQFGKPVILAVVRDISERKRAEAEKALIEEQYRQAQKVEAIGRLAGGVAHDLNNILSPIIGFGELLMDDIPSQDERYESVVEIVQAGHRAQDLVRQLLAFGRKQTLEYKTIDLNETIKAFESLLRRTIREDIELEFLPTADIPAIKADIGQIEQVIMNLCVNAQDAMPKGGKLRLTTALTRIDEIAASARQGTTAGSYVLLSISDTGHGIDQTIQTRIFEPFFSTKGEEGTGLGLSTVYGIVKQHSGNVWVESNPGEGATFNVYLPASVEAVTGKETRDHTPNVLKGSETVLIVEDNQQVLKLSDKILRRNGYKTLLAADGTQALQTIKEHSGKVDLVLTDVVMPDMNGKELFKRISDRHPRVKVLYMSGYTDEVIAKRGVLERGVHFIHKPFSKEDLSTKVRSILDRSKPLDP